MNRRDFLARAGLAASLVSLPSVLRAAPLKELRIGYQKAGLLALARQQGIIEKRFPDVTIKWAEFTHGPPLLEALNAGSLDYGYAGNAPPVFAQAARANFSYVAAVPARGDNQGIVVPADSTIKSIADLKGRKLGLAKGTSANDFAIAALEHAGLSFKDVTPVFLPPADAASAFAKGAVDAWSIWDPFLAIVEGKGARRLAGPFEVAQQNSFFLASKDFLATNPAAVAGINEELTRISAWAKSNRDEAAKLFSEATGVDLAAQKVAVNRTQFDLAPLDDAIVRQQQAVADRFARIGLIPKQIVIADVVWKWTPGS